MASYYNIVEGNLHTGDIAKSTDINHIQIHVRDALRALLDDLHDGSSYIVGSGEEHKNDFVITPAHKYRGRYVDARNVFDVSPDKTININRYTIRQPIPITKQSVYSIIIRAKNTSNRDIPITCKLQNPAEEEPLAVTEITLGKNEENQEIEVVFDLDYFPTAPNLDYAALIERDGKDIPPITEEESYDEGYVKDIHDAETQSTNSIGVSQLYFIMEKADCNEESLAELYPKATDDIIFDANTSLGIYYSSEIPITDKEMFCETREGVNYVKEENKIIFYEVVFANNPTYLCSGGEAVIHGEKVLCIDNSISIGGANDSGNLLSQIYLGTDGHLHSFNYQLSTTESPSEFILDPDDTPPMAYFPIALILTYGNNQGVAKDPLIIQTQKYDQLPLSHHERLRRLEKKLDWVSDLAVPSRIKYTLSGEEWLDENGGDIISNYPSAKTDSNGKGSNGESQSYYTAIDANGNVIIRLANKPITTIKSTIKKAKTKNQSTEDITASQFSEIVKLKHDEKEGTLTLNTIQTAKAISTTEKEAKTTEFNPWDDTKANRPTGDKIEKHEREYTVVSGRNGRYDEDSEYPAMTLYCDSNLKLEKLQIPITKFQNCSGVKFFIWKRQGSNNKKNTVWLEKKVYTSKVFSLKKAVTKGKYQYVDKGFTINFGKGGLSLPKGQYVIIALPIPKSGKGSLFVETYKPKNSKDFCIRYHGTANATHFTLKTRYQEVWYNAAKATVAEENFEKSGTATSKTITWKNTSLTPIKSVTPRINIDLPQKHKTSYKLEVNVGDGWKEVKDKKATSVNGYSFRWRITLYGDEKATPKLSYNSKLGYAIQFTLERGQVGGTNVNTEDLEKNMCLTSKAIDGDDVLRDYVGDDNLGKVQSKFNQHEFARIWADEDMNENLLIDIQGSDKDFNYTIKDGNDNTTKTGTGRLWSLNYADLTLKDFEKINVDYSDYNEDIESDENNLRLKLDSDHSYNDNDINISGLKTFTKWVNDIDTSQDSTMTFVNKQVEKTTADSADDTSTSNTSTSDTDTSGTDTSSTDSTDDLNNIETITYDNKDWTTNQTFMKMTLDNPIDLTKYTGLMFEFTSSSTVTTQTILKGFGIYISSDAEEDTPSNVINLPEQFPESSKLTGVQTLPKTIVPGESSEDFYDGKLLIFENTSKDKGDKATEYEYYQYIQEFDEETGSTVYNLQQYHDIRSYNIYEPNPIKHTKGTTDQTHCIRIEIDQESQKLKHVKEIGFISLNDELDEEGNTKYGVFTGADGSEELKGTFKLSFNNIKGLSQDYYTIFDPEKSVEFATDIPACVKTYKNGSLPFKETSDFETNTDIPIRYERDIGNNNKFNSTTPKTTMINIDRKSVLLDQANSPGETILCYINNEYEGGLSNYKHFSVKIAADVYIPKDCIKINLCAKPNGEDPFATLNVPTLNSLFSPIDTQNNIFLTQIFKKININESIKSISIVATKHFAKTMASITQTDKNYVNLFIGKIVLYKAETIPMFHKAMRFKFYMLENGEIKHLENKNIEKDDISIRKIGSVLDYG